MSILSKVDEASSSIQKQLDSEPEIGLVLGSGLGELAEKVEERTEFPAENIPHYPESTVEGHSGKVVIGSLAGKKVAVMQGRKHYYESGDMEKVTFPIMLMNKLGVQKILLTNAAGGVNLDLLPGNLMLITDHINNMGDNPLIGLGDAAGLQFPDMTEAYSEELIDLANRVASDQGIELKQGVYAANTGPSYETPAEVKMLRKMGADAVGMSTVPEVIMANYLGLDAIGISLITNPAAGVTDSELSHEEVIQTAEEQKPVFKNLVLEIIREM